MGTIRLFNDSMSRVEKEHWDRLAALFSSVEQRPTPPLVGRNLILGTATNYTTKEIAPFIRSLRDTGYRDDVVLWVSDLDSATKRLLKRYGVHLQYAWEMDFMPFDSLLSRFFAYYGFLRAMENRDQHADGVFLTDVRDVVFQADPFHSPPAGDIVVYLEDASKTLDTCGWCSRWLREGFGEEALEELRGRRISCAGTVLGTWNGMLRYLLMMQMTTFEATAAARRRWGFDQGVHNMLVHHNRLSGLTIAENVEHVFTMGYVPERDILISPDKKVADRGGRICPRSEEH